MLTLWNNWKSAILTGGFLAILILIFWAVNAFSQLSLSLNNAYFIPADQKSNDIILVAIDDASLSEYGRTPAEWSRALYGELAEIVAEGGARVLAFDLIFSEPSAQDSEFAQSLQTVRESDARTRIILSGAGVQVPSTDLINPDFPYGLHYADALIPNTTLRQHADYIGYVNAFPDVDGRLRRQPSIIEVNNQLGFSFNLAIFFAHRRIPAEAIPQVTTAEGSSLHLTDMLVLPVDNNGLWIQNFFGTPYIPQGNNAFDVVSFRDVIDGRVTADFFADKIVMVGLMNSLGATDQYLVPASQNGVLMSGVEIQANAVESLLKSTPLIAQSGASQVIMIVALTLISSVIYDKPRWYWKIALWLILLLAFFVIAFLLFLTQRQLINLFYGGLAISLPALVTIGVEVSREITRRRRTEFLLQSVVSIAQQNMVLENVLPIIADDVQQIVPNSGGFIWVYTSENRSKPREHRWRLSVANNGLSDVAQRAIKTQTTQSDANNLAVPIVWQGDVLGVIAVQSARLQWNTARVSLLEELAQRLAPSLDNLMLHRSLSHQNNLLALVLSNSPASIIVIDDDGHILRSNDRFALWMTSTPDEVASANLYDLLAKRGVEENVMNTITRKLEANLAFDLQIEDDLKHYLRLSSAPIKEIGQWIMVFNDVTDLVQLNQLKTQMIRMASHDLKNPLARVLGYSEIIYTEGVLTDNNQRFLKNIMDAADEINHIITDVLDLEQMRAGNLEMKSVSFKNLVREIVSRFEPDKDRKHQTLTLDMPHSPITVSADYVRLGQAVSNLVSNAIKYTPESGEIFVSIHQPGPNIVQLAVRDNGIGIPKESQEKLFTEFYRVKTQATRGISGTGLGLSLVKSVVDAHEGEVWVESEEGKGSTFYISLPVIIPAE